MDCGVWDVRPEAPGDFDAVRAVHERAFDPQQGEPALVDALRASGDHVPDLCLVARHGGSVVGHIAFSRARLDSGDPVLALAPMGVVPEHQGRGAGSALIAEALRRAAATDFPLIVVLGHADYYARFGFEPAGELGIDAPFPVLPEAWMALRLPAYRPGVRGKVIYPDAFAGVT